MRICFMAHAASEHTQRFVSYFVERGHTCDLISFTPGRVPGAAVHCLPSFRRVSPEGGNWQHLLQLPRVARLLRAIQPDLVNAHFATSYGLLAGLAHRGRAPIILRAGGSDVLTLPYRHLGYYLAARYALRRAASVICPAGHMAEHVRGWVGDDRPILVCQYGIDTDVFHPPRRRRATPAACLCNRAWVANSNIDTIFSAMGRLKQIGSDARLTLLGGGPLAGEVDRHIHSLCLSDRVLCVGRVSHAAMPGHLHRHSIWISVTSSDGLPMSLIEAMACGLFPVVSDIPAYREHIKDGVNGFLVEPHDDAVLAERILAAIVDRKLRRRAAAMNWAMVQDRLDFRQNMRRIESHFVEMVRRGT